MLWCWYQPDREKAETAAHVLRSGVQERFPSFFCFSFLCFCPGMYLSGLLRPHATELSPRAESQL